MKKIYVTLGILSVGMIAMAYLYFSNLNTETNANDLSLNAVSANTGIVFSFENDKSFYEILSGQELFQNILGETKSKQFKALRANLIDLPLVYNAFDGQKIYIGILPGEKDKVDFLIATQFKSDNESQKILNELKAKNVQVSQTDQVYQLTFADRTTAFVGLKNKLVLIASTAKAIQDLLKEQKSSSSGFAAYIKANSRFNKNTLANLYIDFNQIPALLKDILNSNINGELSIFNKQNTYAALSYNYSRDKLLFNGNTTINDPNSYYSLFTKIPEQKITIDNILPQKTANYAIYTVSNYKLWQQELTTWMNRHKENEKVKKNITAINQKYRLDLNQIFPKYFKDQFITFQLNSGEKFGAMALSNGEKVSQLLLDLSAEYESDIRIFKDPDILYSFFGEPFKKFNRPFYTIIDNYLIVANNASSIQVFLNSYKTNALLINDEDYIALNNQLSASATISFYVNNKNSNDIFGRNLKTPYFSQYQSNSGFRKYSGFCYQLSADNGKFLSNLLLYKTPEKTIEVDTTKTNPF